MSELNRDLYCLGCGYNLRGLSGDPLRCPECGMFNALADLEVPAAMIRRAVRRLETGPAFCTGAVVMWLCLVPVLLAGLAGFRGTAPPPKEILIFLMIVIAFAAAGWIVGVIMFRSSCGEKPGWGIALAKFHLYGAGVAAFFFAAIASGLFALIRLLFFLVASQPSKVAALHAGISGLTCVFSVIVTRWFLRRAKASVAPLQRDCAARLAHQFSSKGRSFLG